VFRRARAWESKKFNSRKLKEKTGIEKNWATGENGEEKEKETWLHR